MKKIALTFVLALSSILAYSQTTKSSKEVTKPKQEVKPVDSTIVVKLSPQQLKEITSIINQASTVITKSNAPMDLGTQTVQSLNAIIVFFKQFEPKK